ncbi:MAG: transporter substrate-binding domain-containing protein [Candidatus Delongbacteria bacterium]|nr:transporter substrate-binding domain-containing protein [Candidatus Delongbacteria bacterium]
MKTGWIKIGWMALIFCWMSLSLTADRLVIAISNDIPPYVTDQSKGGIEIDIIKEALIHKGHTFNTIQCSYKELATAVKDKRADAAAGVRQMDDSTFYSDYFIQFKNVAVTKKKNKIKLDKITDLKDKSIITWQNAHRDLGPEFESLFSPSVEAPYIEKYKELPVQADQVDMFWKDQAEVIIIDEIIFKWFSKKLSGLKKPDQEVVYHYLFPEITEFQLNFKDSRIRDDFNKGLKYIRDEGIYKEIIDCYIK